MRKKYKKKQLQEKKEDLRLAKSKDRDIYKKEQPNIQKTVNQNISFLNTNKSIYKYHKITTINDSQSEISNNRLKNKNASSISFRKGITGNDRYNKVFNDKKNETYFKNENKENNEKTNDYNIKKINKYNLNKEPLINKITNTNNTQNQFNNNNGGEDNFPLTKNNSQKFTSIFVNSETNKKSKIYYSVRNKLNNNNNNNLNTNIVDNKNNYNNNNLNTNIVDNKNNNNNNNLNTNIVDNKNRSYNLIEDKNTGDTNNKNYQKLSVKDSAKNFSVYNINSRNRNHLNNNNDYYSNRKNKNIINKNINSNNNNCSLNEKSNSLSIISEKISLLNSYEDNSNSLQKDEIEKIDDKKIVSSKKYDNTERNSNKSYFNIIETEIKEENGNAKRNRNILHKNRRINSIFQNKNYDNNNQTNKSINLLTPKLDKDISHYNKSTLNNETNIIIDDIDKKNNINNEDVQLPKTISSTNIINRIKRDNYILNRRVQNSINYTNYCGPFRKLNDNNNNSNDLTNKSKTSKENIENIDNSNNNQINHNETISLENDTIPKIKEFIKINKNNDSFLKSENEIINNKEKKINKEININTNINVNEKNYRNEENLISPLMKKNQSLPLKSFKFLVHQANYNNLIKDSFNKYYEENKLNNNINNMNESITLSTETNFSGKMKYNNVLSDMLDLSKRDYFKSPASNISNFCYNNDICSEENDKKKPNISIKQKLIKTNKSDFFNNVMNSSYDNDKNNNYNYKNFFSNNIKNSKKYGNEIINNNIYSTTLNIYKINDNNNDDINQIKSILAPSLKTNILINSKLKNNDNIIKIDDNNNNNTINNTNYNANNYKINNNIPSLLYSNDTEIELFYNLEKKILLLISKIEDYKICKNECYDYINYYFENRIDEHIKRLFINNHNRINIINYIKLELLCYLLCYDISNSKYFNQAAILIKSIMIILNNNFLLIILLILTNINKNAIEKNKEISQNDKIIISELNKIIKKNLTIRVDEENINELYIIQNISNNTKDINNYYKMILDNLYKDYYSLKSVYNNSNKYKFPNCINNSNYNFNEKKIIITLFFYDSYRLLNNYKIIELKSFFDIFLDKSKNFNYETEVNEIPKSNDDMDILQTTTSLSLSNNSTLKLKILSKSKDISILKNKYKIFILPDINKQKYKYSLILSLNEILIYFDKSICSYMIRPGLFEFLKEMKDLYELILFTSNFSNYEEQIIENIQQNNNFFEYILNRKNGIDNANSFIQDLVSLNRNLKQFIIIDTTLNKFKIHRNNILTIKPFYGDIRNDKNTLNFLSQLLQRIRMDVETSEDIRISINKYKKSFIYSKIAK